MSEMPMSEMIEKVARALLMENRPDYTPKQIEHGWFQYRFDARAAIEAMREPTNEMAEVGMEARWQSPIRDANNVREIWSAMIDAALSEDGATEETT